MWRRARQHDDGPLTVVLGPRTERLVTLRAALVEMMLGGPWQRRLLVRLGLWEWLNRRACAWIGHKPMVTLDPSYIEVSVLSPCQRCGAIVEQTADLIAPAPRLRVVKGGKD